jgi:hypothetical protein
MAYRKFTPRWSLAGDDQRMTSWYFVTGANEDEEDAVEQAWDVLWAALRTNFHSSLVLDELRWYFSASLVPRGAAWGDADRTIDRNSAGTAAGNAFPPQCSIVVTYPRPSPLKRHMGRNYLPAPAVSAGSAGGKISVAIVDAIANAMETFLESCVAVGYQPVTIARVQGVDTALIIPELRVDDVFDTQRRRGYETSGYNAHRVLTTVP